uniref:Uncharacterized protein n=1 Tax=Anguilla anguilla TaxID=7936 RepID=A0A0E9VGD3_ANGAN
MEDMPKIDREAASEMVEIATKLIMFLVNSQELDFVCIY